jgi:hypothetical protein
VLFEKAKSMALTFNFPTYLWMEAINTIIDLSNQSPSKSSKRINLKEKYLGLPLWMDHLKIFSSFTYVYVPQNQPIKLDSWSIICMLVGFDNTTKGYILSINPWMRKMVISKDVVMDELIRELCNKSYDLNMLNNVTWQYYHLQKKGYINQTSRWMSMRQPHEMKNLSLENSPWKLHDLLQDQPTKQPL